VIEQSLDRVAFRFITADRRDCDDECFRSTEDEYSKVAMALRGAIAWFRMAEFASASVWTAVVVDIDEVEADDPRAGAEDHRRLLTEEVVDDGFEFVRWDSVQLCQCVVVEVRSTSTVGDGLDGLLIDTSLEECLPDDPEVEAAAFDSGDGNLREEFKRYGFKISSRNNTVWLV